MFNDNIQQNESVEKKSKSAHLALQLPEIVDRIMYFLTVPIHMIDEQHKHKLYENIYPCLFINGLWHDCAVRWIWKHVTFEDSKSEFDALLRFCYTVGGNDTQDYAPPHPMRSSSTAANLAIASSPNVSTIRYYPSFYSPYAHYTQHRKAIRSITLRKIKDKAINKPLMQIGRYTQRLEKLDIYICDHLADSSVHTFITYNHNSLTFLSLAGCNRITDEAIISVAHHCPKLMHLDLRACGLISDVSIKAIATHCPNLFHLNVGRVRDREKITMASINLVAQQTQVGVLGLAGCDITDECLILLAQARNKGLERISVNNCYRITNRSLRAYVTYCPNLSVFEMKECHRINDWSAVAELVQRKVLLTLCEQQNKSCLEWARQRGRVLTVKPPIKSP
ncbi:hypothetical protein BDF20DRAFT_904650 [Mycotypha africana]|uniref:uncharacterized protein n=1 Tax=Mycotypha africana TaxID=64632 RepID=UPI0023003A86|nr:uncharacterized protein BDF20DRAFT_904650 [Mycotypha africana]KAI8987641.1 hypothetical protein BDF20DRAFT_904650 [Mycotypha africana]